MKTQPRIFSKNEYLQSKMKKIWANETLGTKLFENRFKKILTMRLISLKTGIKLNCPSGKTMKYLQIILSYATYVQKFNIKE